MANKLLTGTNYFDSFADGQEPEVRVRSLKLAKPGEILEVLRFITNDSHGLSPRGHILATQASRPGRRASG